MNLEELQKIVWEENQRLPKASLVILTEGNVSQISPDRSYFVIKPSGIEYSRLTPDMMVAVDMEGKIITENSLRPSTDTETHLEIYKRFPEISGIAHTHSPYATIFSQSKKPIICYGTTHADIFSGDIPVTRDMTEGEIMGEFERNTGLVIAEILKRKFAPCVLVASHGPFTFGSSAKKAVDHAESLEKIAMMAALGNYENRIHEALLTKHHERKHGKNSYYGQQIKEA